MAFTEETVLVLGAGASCHYGYPTGQELIDKVYNFFSIQEDNYSSVGSIGEQKIRNYNQEIQLQLNKFNIEKVLTLRNRIKFFDPFSIDSFISHQLRDSDVLQTHAKLLVADVILSSEKKCVFEKGASHDFYAGANKTYNESVKNWYRLLFNSLVEGSSVSDLAQEGQNLRFNVVTFNYDVSLEYYLYTRIQNGSYFSEEQKTLFLNNLSSRIHHVYGSVRQYEWMGGDSPNDEYGVDERQKHKLAIEASEHIKVINEDRANLENTNQKIREVMLNAKKIIFLGFGFNEDNMQMIMPREYLHLKEPYNVDKVYYTNMANSKVINDTVEKHFRKGAYNGVNTVKSDKDVNDALMHDFSLT